MLPTKKDEPSEIIGYAFTLFGIESRDGKKKYGAVEGFAPIWSNTESDVSSTAKESSKGTEPENAKNKKGRKKNQ
jgi:hypothetical protein